MADLDPLHVVKRTLYCGGPAIGLSRWLAAAHPSGDPGEVWPQLQDRWVVGTHRGRSAIALACRVLGIGPGSEVLVPSYNCGTEIDAVLHSGARIVGYQVSRKCEIDLADLMARRSNCARAVYLIHYFGWEQPMTELRRWCDNEGLFLIEDCALALFSGGSSGGIGRTGDAAIFSLPKTLGFCHGGLLSMSASRAAEMQRPAPAAFSTLLKEIEHSVRSKSFGGLEWLGLYGGLLSARRRLRRNHQLHADDEFPEMPGDYYFNCQMDLDRPIHPQVWAVARSVSWEEIVHRRRSNYLRLAGALAGVQGVTPLYHRLPEGVCPLSLPLMVSDRDACVGALHARGIGAFPWWAGFHRNGIDWSEFPDSCWLKRHVLTLPVHQGLDDRHLDYVAETATQVFRSARPAAGPSFHEPRLSPVSRSKFPS